MKLLILLPLLASVSTQVYAHASKPRFPTQVAYIPLPKFGDPAILDDGSFTLRLDSQTSVEGTPDGSISYTTAVSSKEIHLDHRCLPSSPDQSPQDRDDVFTHIRDLWKSLPFSIPEKTNQSPSRVNRFLSKVKLSRKTRLAEPNDKTAGATIHPIDDYTVSFFTNGNVFVKDTGSSGSSFSFSSASDSSDPVVLSDFIISSDASGRKVYCLEDGSKVFSFHKRPLFRLDHAGSLLPIDIPTSLRLAHFTPGARPEKPADPSTESLSTKIHENPQLFGPDSIDFLLRNLNRHILESPKSPWKVTTLEALFKAIAHYQHNAIISTLYSVHNITSDIITNPPPTAYISIELPSPSLPLIIHYKGKKIEYIYEVELHGNKRTTRVPLGNDKEASTSHTARSNSSPKRPRLLAVNIPDRLFSIEMPHRSHPDSFSENLAKNNPRPFAVNIPISLPLLTLL